MRRSTDEMSHREVKVLFAETWAMSFRVTEKFGLSMDEKSGRGPVTFQGDSKYLGRDISSQTDSAVN